MNLLLTGKVAAHVNDLRRYKGDLDRQYDVIREFYKSLMPMLGWERENSDCGRDYGYTTFCRGVVDRTNEVFDQISRLKGTKFRRVLEEIGINWTTHGCDEPLTVEEFDRLLRDLERKMENLSKNRDPDPMAEAVRKAMKKANRQNANLIDVLV